MSFVLSSTSICRSLGQRRPSTVVALHEQHRANDAHASVQLCVDMSVVDVDRKQARERIEHMRPGRHAPRADAQAALS